MIFSVILTIFGFAWYQSNPVSAGYPAFLLILIGTCGLAITWYLS